MLLPRLPRQDLAGLGALVVLTLDATNERGAVGWAQEVVTREHYLHAPVDVRCRPLVYLLRYHYSYGAHAAAGPRCVGIFIVGRPEATRPENITYEAPWGSTAWPWPDNVWLGTSVENQAAANARIPHLLRVPARVRFLSCEPLLGPVDIDQACRHSDGTRRPGWGLDLHWIIAGGESGANARPMHQRWVRSLRDQAQAAGVAFFFKQWGEWIGGGDWEYDTMDVLEKRSLWAGQSNDPDDLPTLHYRVGKKAAGRLLDDREWNEVPA